MWSFVASALLLLCALSHQSSAAQSKSKRQTCRNVPGSAGFPDAAAWRAFNASVSGRLVTVVPSAKFCSTRPGGCTDAEWSSALFRSAIPGAMNQVNWEQGYDLTPPSLCVINGTTCGQGDVPVYSVEAETVADIQAAVKFATAHNLRVAVKVSGHDYLGRSTAPNSLLIHTNKFVNVSVTDAFFVGSQNMGSAVTVGSGVHSQDLYQQAKANGKIAVGGSAATVVAAGGYLQGAGHSAVAPLFGLAADNVFEFHIVIASGELLQVPTPTVLFYALRGGGAGSWGVIVSATFRTFPTFNATFASITLSGSSNTAMASLATLHAKHIFDFDATRSSQYFYLTRSSATSTPFLTLSNYMINQTVAQAQAILVPFMTAALALPGITLVSSSYTYALINDILYMTDDNAGFNVALGSRLIPATTYRNSPQTVGKVYKELLDGGALEILGHLVAGGQVAANAHISSAVNPAWRTAKTHLIIGNNWLDSMPLAQINTIRKQFQTSQLPILEQMSGPNAGAYSNEADVTEPNFQTTFFGPNYAKLSAIKAKYDPKDLFIVRAGVGSERWDEWGLCTSSSH
ncbi:FAD-binding domain-containing protein [Mycena leptocephala]|nr:FAD-binding domain-containing protein [Mycena leptocephala]